MKVFIILFTTVKLKQHTVQKKAEMEVCIVLSNTTVNSTINTTVNTQTVGVNKNLYQMFCIF